MKLMKKSTKALLGLAGAAAGAAGLTLAVGEALYRCSLTFEGLTFVQSKRENNPARMDDLKPTDFSAPLPNWFGETNHTYVHSTNCLGEVTTAECIDDFPDSDRWVILVHGYTANPHSMAKYGKYYHEKQFNMIYPCMRGHKNGCDHKISMGWLDRYDIIGWIYFILQRCPDAQIVLHGESMGAATVMMTVGEQLPSNVVCAVEDCGYTSVWDEFEYQIGELFHLPKYPFLPAGQFMTKFHGGIDFKEASEKSEIYLIFGKESTGIPGEILRANLDRCFRIPMAADCRCLNVSNAAAVAIYEVLRQLNYPGLSFKEEQKGEDFLEENYSYDETLRRKRK